MSFVTVDVVVVDGLLVVETKTAAECEATVVWSLLEEEDRTLWVTFASLLVKLEVILEMVSSCFS